MSVPYHTALHVVVVSRSSGPVRCISSTPYGFFSPPPLPLPFHFVPPPSASNGKFSYDFFHHQIAEGHLLAKLEKNFNQVGVVHIADVPGRHDPGTGEINYPNIFRKLGQLGFNGYVAMEFIPEGDPVQALRAAREMAVKYGSVQPNQSARSISPGGPHAAA